MRPFSSIELACAVRQPSPCVRALCESGVLFHMSHFKLDLTLHTSHCTLHTSHFTLETSQSTLHSPHFSLLIAFFTLHTSHFTLHSSGPTLHTALFTLHTSSHRSSSRRFCMSARLSVTHVDSSTCQKA